ncbi:MAG: hypothetical protein QOH05_3436, partial [Acetobacteraceae bacterium]|nr:hypothetical protein [Acetobacteraceae bacterium]
KSHDRYDQDQQSGAETDNRRDSESKQQESISRYSGMHVLPYKTRLERNMKCENQSKG